MNRSADMMEIWKEYVKSIFKIKKKKRIIVKIIPKKTQTIPHLVQSHPTREANLHGPKNEIILEAMFYLGSLFLQL